MSGWLIALEGIDGSGTTTLARSLDLWLRDLGRPHLITAEPSDGEVGQLIRRGLNQGSSLDEGTLALLFAADRLDHLSRVIEPALAQGLIVISDRYLLSSLAYQSSMLPEDWVASLNRLARPADATILLDAPAEVGLARLAGRPALERYEHLEFLRKVRRKYLDLAGEMADRGERVAVIETLPIQAEVAGLARKTLADIFPELRPRP